MPRNKNANFPHDLFRRYLEHITEEPEECVTHILPKKPDDEPPTHEDPVELVHEIKSYFNQQNKQLSQYIAKLWLSMRTGKPLKKEEAQQKYFTLANGSSRQIINLLRREAGVDLKLIFGHPLQVISDWSSFYGKWIELPNEVEVKEDEDDEDGEDDEKKKQYAGFFITSFPTPPLPSEDILPTSALDGWVKSPPGEPFFPQHPYIPLTGGG